MNLQVHWVKCQDGSWANLYAVDLDHAHFNELEGVYIVWHGGAKTEPLRVGAGLIRSKIEACRKDPAIRLFNDRELYATWACVDPGIRDSVVHFLCKKLAPKAQDEVPDALPIAINLPHESVTGDAPPPPNRLPTQSWVDMVGDANHLSDAEKRSEHHARAPHAAPEPRPHQRVCEGIGDILAQCALYNAGDVLLIPREPPMIRRDGALVRLPNTAPLNSEDCKKTVYSMLTEIQKESFERDGELDCAFTLKDMRYRVNVYGQNNGVAAALRMISPKIPEPEQIGLSPAILKLASLPRGLLLVTGPTGAGKTTTLACLIDYINKNFKKHIITVEDPIEFIFQNKKSIIDQREVGQHTASFAQALRYTLRQNPDVILIGEMRDRDTAELAIRAAETGHLCISTLHTQDAPSTIDRIVSEFPSDQRQKLCNILSGVLAGVISQVLVPRKDGGRVCVREVMIMNTAIANLLREDKVHQIRSAMEGAISDGMHTLDQALAMLVKKHVITLEEARSWSHSPKSLDQLLENVRLNPRTPG
ncbi:MAG: type IV pilus twitching motility protein PilT [Elusimicrobiota bacterium]